MGKRIKNFILLLLQRLWITMELFSKNGLVNHAAAGAFGLLFAAAPALLFISFFVYRAFAAYPELTVGLFQSNSFLSGVINLSDLINNYLNYSGPGLAGIISAVAILWTVFICALSIQRGLLVIFSRSRSKPIRKSAMTLVLAFIIILFIFISLLGSRLAVYFHNFIGFSLFGPFSSTILALPVRIISIVYLPLMTLVAYRFVPPVPPKMKHIIPGVAICIILYQIFSTGFSLIIGPDRYNLLYGTLGRLFLFLINIYFFFWFFFYGAQMIMTLHHSDVLLFIRFRYAYNKKITDEFSGKERLPGNFFNLVKSLPRLSMAVKETLFRNIPEPLKKYLRTYREGATVFQKGSKGHSVYYVISGDAGVYLDSELQNRITTVKPGYFFGITEIITPEGRANSLKAETDLTVMKLPSGLFYSILKMDPDTDQNIMKTLSERIKTLNKRVMGTSPRK